MKKYICIAGKPIDKKDDFMSFLNVLDEENAEIHVYGVEEFEKSKLDDYIYIINQCLENIKSDDSICIVSNYMDLLISIDSTFKSFINGYIYYNNECKRINLEVFENHSINKKLYFSNPQTIGMITDGYICKDARIYAFDIEESLYALNDFINIKAGQLLKVFSIKERMDKINELSYYNDNDNDKCLKRYFECKLSNESTVLSDYTRIYIYSLLIKKWKNNKYIDEAIQLTRISDEFSTEIKFFIYYQITNWFFLDSGLATEKSGIRLNELYINIYNDYANRLKEHLNFISESDRNKDLIFVFTGQLLALSHGPTKTVLDRCYILKKKMNKQVYLINTAEVLSIAAAIPIWDMRYGLYQEKYSSLNEIAYKDTSFPLLQLSEKMPDISEISQIVQAVKEHKPHYILSIGATLTADLCSNIVPVITLSTVLSTIMRTQGQFQQIGRKLTEADLDYLKKCGKNKDHIIEGIFTYEFKPQTLHFTKRELGIPEDKFIIVTAGARLNDEITDEFIDMLISLFNYNAHIVFMGIFDTMYEKYCVKYPVLRDNSTYIGFQSDVLAVFECCSLYINPKRRGGGGAILEAMYKGLPAITLNYGDAAVNAGKGFIVNNYDDMVKEAERYITDTKYYQSQSLLAKRRAKMMCDSEQYFVDIIKKAMEREAFYYTALG